MSEHPCARWYAKKPGIVCVFNGGILGVCLCEQHYSGRTMNNLVSDKFRKMASNIDLNAEAANFGGAFVVIPPEGGGEAIETLILDSKQDPSQFWSLLQAKASLMIAELEEKKRLSGTFGGRR